MSPDETATCTVLDWQPEKVLRLTWDYTGEGPTELLLELAGDGEATILTLVHRLSAVEPVQYGAGWHVSLDTLVAHLTGDEPADFMSAFHELEPLYRAAAT